MEAYNKIILYNDINMEYLTGTMYEYTFERERILRQRINGINDYELSPTIKVEGTIVGFDKSETIKLDETLMKRIAKYNKEAEIEKYNEIIKEKKEKIKELDDILKDRGKRVEKLKKFIAEIYDMDIEDIEDEDYF